jgi:hypothetical protein
MAINIVLEKYYLSRMYNMDIAIFGYKLNLEILILIGIIYLILVVHTLAGTCNMNKVKEGLEVMMGEGETGGTGDGTDKTVMSNGTGMPDRTGGNMTAGEEPEGMSIPKNAKSSGSKMNGKVTESFVGANTNYGQSSPYDLATQTVVDTASWNQPDMTVVPGKPLSDGVKKFLARQPQPVPLPEGQLDMFATTPFKPECCPNTYSNSMGCACMTGQQYNALITRFGNNVPYSEY